MPLAWLRPAHQADTVIQNGNITAPGYLAIARATMIAKPMQRSMGAGLE